MSTTADLSQLLQQQQAGAGGSYASAGQQLVSEIEKRKGGTAKADVQAYGATLGGAGAAAGCAAVGAAPAGPLCSAIGSAVGKLVTGVAVDAANGLVLSLSPKKQRRSLKAVVEFARDAQTERDKALVSVARQLSLAWKAAAPNAAPITDAEVIALLGKAGTPLIKDPQGRLRVPFYRSLIWDKPVVEAPWTRCTPERCDSGKIDLGEAKKRKPNLERHLADWDSRFEKAVKAVTAALVDLAIKKEAESLSKREGEAIARREARDRVEAAKVALVAARERELARAQEVRRQSLDRALLAGLAAEARRVDDRQRLLVGGAVVLGLAGAGALAWHALRRKGR